MWHQRFRNTAIGCGVAAIAYLAGITSVFAFGQTTGRFFTSLGLRMIRAGDTPRLDYVNEDDATLNDPDRPQGVGARHR
jgi:hypothetical protein